MASAFGVETHPEVQKMLLDLKLHCGHRVGERMTTFMGKLLYSSSPDELHANDATGWVNAAKKYHQRQQQQSTASTAPSAMRKRAKCVEELMQHAIVSHFRSTCEECCARQKIGNECGE